MNSVDRWLRDLGYDAVPGVTIRRSEGCSANQPFATEMRGLFAVNGEVRADAFACVDQVPTIALLDRLSLPADGEACRLAIRSFCERLWNQNLARIVLVTMPDAFEAWSVDNPRIEPEHIGSDDSAALATWSLSGVLGGSVLKGRERWFDVEQRVDKTLLESIQDLVSTMRTDQLAPPPLSRELIARVIFVGYLEDRGIVSDDYRAQHELGWLYDLLGRHDVAGLDRLFRQLQKDFNGDFLKPVATGSFWSDLPPAVFDLLHQFLSRTVVRSGQQDFWRYDFSEIPIELIAGIYETFLASKDDEVETDDGMERPRVLDPRQTPSARAKRKQGAYYTPRLLADTVVDMAFEGREPDDQRIFDGACGSGMLLTAAFRRLIRSRQAKAEQEGLDEEAYGFDARCGILRNQIFGADIDEDACRLTSFSLYLALLSDLAPRDLAVLRAGGRKLPSLVDNIRRGVVEGDFFSEESERANHKLFTVLLSNPPWRKLRAGDPALATVSNWVARQGAIKPHLPTQEIAAAFTLAAANCLVQGGRAVLVLPINLFLSTERTRREFRADLLQRFHVERIVNFADMRYLLFADARHPFVVLVGEVRDEVGAARLSGERFAYQTPKADIALAFGRLSLHDADANEMPASALLDPIAHLALRYWGDAQDYQMLLRLWSHGRIGDLIEHGWVAGKGFHLTDDDRRRPPETWSVPTPQSFRDKPFLDAKQLARDLPVIDRQVLKPFPFDVIARVPEEEERLFCGPRILWPDGTNPAKGINAIYADAPFTFQHSLGVLSAPNDEIGRLTARFITCYMRSTLGSWLSILLSASVSAERAKLHKAELADWPFWSLSDHPDRPRAERVLHEVDAVMASIETTGILSAPAAYAALVERLNELVFDYFGINKGERATIIELARVIGPSIQPAGLGYKSMVKPLRSQPDATILAKYAERLLAEMARWRDATGGQGDLAATIWTARRVPLGAAILQIVHDDDVHPQPRVADDDILEEIGAALVRVAGRADAGLFRIPNLTIIDGRRILIIKPLVARYWLERSSVADAARIAVELQAAQPLAKKERSPSSPRTGRSYE